MDKEVPCSELKTKADDARCEKKCNKVRDICVVLKKDAHVHLVINGMKLRFSERSVSK